jgi:hypothetical protein
MATDTGYKISKSYGFRNGSKRIFDQGQKEVKNQVDFK